jgi:hypothetical protein
MNVCNAQLQNHRRLFSGQAEEAAMKLFLSFVLIFLFISTAPVAAKTIKLQCQSSKRPGGYVATVDYDKKTMTVEALDGAGNIYNLGYGIMRAAITSDSIIGDTNQPCGTIRWILNRRSGILLSINGPSCGDTSLSKPCVPYEVHRQRF